MTRQKTMHHVALDGHEYLVIGVPLVDESRADPLTSAEREVAQLAVRGLSNREIAETRGTSIPTVVNQLGAIYRKLGVSGRVGLCAHFAR
ncbi:MAG: helix-turn-helix transcriptional regulator [Sandaracinaceae bacterium]